MTQPIGGHVHRWIPSRTGSKRTLLLLHGTGGDENDLVPLASAVAPDANVLSPRGNVLENGAPRFFRRHGVGQLDLEDLHRRTIELADHVRDASARYGFDLGEVAAIGFSNGANIAASLLFERPEVLGSAALIRAMLPYEPPAPPAVRGKRVLLLAGERDPYSRREVTEALARILRSGGAEVDARFAPAGHELVESDVSALRAWLASDR